MKAGSDLNSKNWKKIEIKFGQNYLLEMNSLAKKFLANLRQPSKDEYNLERTDSLLKRMDKFILKSVSFSQRTFQGSSRGWMDENFVSNKDEYNPKRERNKNELKNKKNYIIINSVLAVFVAILVMIKKFRR
jgi:hypothetical protein